MNTSLNIYGIIAVSLLLQTEAFATVTEPDVDYAGKSWGTTPSEASSWAKTPSKAFSDNRQDIELKDKGIPNESNLNRQTNYKRNEFEPLIDLDENSQPTVTTTFASNVLANLLGGDLAYAETKRNATLAKPLQEELENMGWRKVDVFRAWEGKNMQFGNVAGVIMYNQKNNMYNVI